jgi:hypothetical protein
MEYARVSQGDKGWNEVQTKVSQKSKRFKKRAAHGRGEIGHGVSKLVVFQRFLS